SVGYRIEQEALLFGGTTPTLTDAAMLAGASIGGRSLPTQRPGVRAALKTALTTAHADLESAVERLSLGRTDLPLVVVGGGGFLVPDTLPGAGEVIRPGHGGVANAVGAAISLAGGRADQMSDVEDREAAIESASKAAIDKAIQAGADPLKVAVVDVVETPITYSANPAIRVSVKAAGPLARLGSAVGSRT
ncbi:MAG: hydantoinase/oxoprolinase family protein, partial [Agrococcus casei]